MKHLFRLLYTLGIRKSYRQIDRLHYLKRLSRKKHKHDEWYYSDKDAAQFSGGEILLATDFCGAPVFFLCRPDSHIERQLINRGSYGTNVLSFLAKQVAENEIICDVGANIGAYTVPLAKAFPKTTIHAFEVNPHISARLRRNVRLNRLNNVEIYEFGVGARLANLELHAFNGKDHGMSSFIRPRLPDGEPVTLSVEVVPLDRMYRDETRRIGILKVDVQGFEHQVMTGAEKLIRKWRPFIAFEHEDSNFPDLQQATEAKQALQTFLKANNYDVFYMTRYDSSLLFPVRWDKMLQGDLIAIPSTER